MIEVGVPNFVSDTWNAISAPPSTPAAIVAKLNKAMNDIMNDPEIEEAFRTSSTSIRSAAARPTCASWCRTRPAAGAM